MFELAAAPAFRELHHVGEGAGVTVRLRMLSLASVLARKGAGAALAQKAQRDFALTLVDGPERSAAGGLCALGIGPGRWLFARGGEGDFAGELGAAFAGLASVSDHSDGYAIFEVSGPKARAALAKGVPLDLDPAIFSETDVAVTVVAHIGVVLWRRNGCYALAVFRSYAGSFWRWLAASAAEFGLTVEGE